MRRMAVRHRTREATLDIDDPYRVDALLSEEEQLVQRTVQIGRAHV